MLPRELRLRAAGQAHVAGNAPLKVLGSAVDLADIWDEVDAIAPD